MRYIDKEYSESELNSLYYKAKEYCESQDSQYSFLGTARTGVNVAGAWMGIGRSKRFLKSKAMNTAETHLRRGTAGVIAKKSGMDKEDVDKLMKGAGDLARMHMNERYGLKRNASFLQGADRVGGEVIHRNMDAIRSTGNAITRGVRTAGDWIQSTAGNINSSINTSISS